MSTHKWQCIIKFCYDLLRKSAVGFLMMQFEQVMTVFGMQLCFYMYIENVISAKFSVTLASALLFFNNCIIIMTLQFSYISIKDK